ncbi:HEAT repeat domain-containing protein [Candidatus Fermentibacteria bacterium]|nr:HEAT repeat domain-containing protein [Candidatus Fermentibacteria bacterium]
MTKKRLLRVLLVVLGLVILVSILPNPEKRRWREVERFGSLEGYEDFIAAFPQSRFVPEARHRIEELTFEECEGWGTPEAYQRFLGRYPDGVFSQEAQAAWDSLDWQLAAGEHSHAAWRRYLAAHPQGRHAGDAQARLDAMKGARAPAFRDVRTMKLDIHQSFAEEVDSVIIGFAPEIREFLPYFGLHMVGSDSAADATMTITCHAEALGDNYSLFGVGWGTYYYTGARVSGRLRLETPGGRALHESYRGECPTPHSVTSPPTDPTDAPYDEAMRDGFPPKAVAMLARAFGYPALLGALASPLPRVRETSVAVLQNAGETVRDMLLAALDDSIAPIRAGAAQSLRGHRDAQVVAALVRCLGREGESHAALRDRATESLAALGASSLDQLDRARTDARPLVREGVARSLGGIRTPQSRAILVVLMDDSVNAVSQQAIAALGRHRSREAIDILIERLARDAEQRTACLAALERSTLKDDDEDPGIATMPAALWDAPRVRRLIEAIPLLKSEQQRVTGMLESIGEPAIPALVQAMKSDNIRIRVCAARALGGIFDDRSVAALQAASTDTSRDVRLEVARGLASQGSGESIAHLARLFGDPDPETRSEALGGLNSSLLSTDSRKDYQRYLSSPESIRLLTDAMDIADGSKTGQRDAAAAVLGRIGPPCVDVLLASLRHSNRHVRDGAISALAATGDERAIAALLDLARDPSLNAIPDLTTKLYGALGESKDERVFNALVEGLADTSGTRRAACIRALGTFGKPKAVDSLITLLGGDNPALDSEVRHTIQRLTDHYPEEESFDWKTWWQENRRGYGLR